jgi:hypothetical protein
MCGANLRVIGKAVTLSEAIARSDSVPAKIKDLVKNIKIEKVTDEVARAMEKMVRKSSTRRRIIMTGCGANSGTTFVKQFVGAEKRRRRSSAVKASSPGDSSRCFQESGSGHFFTLLGIRWS